MKFEDYTDDAITQAMGIGSFVPSGLSSAIRLLLKPSFHPELCITLEPDTISVVGLKSMLWSEPVPRHMENLSDLASFSADDFARAADAVVLISENQQTQKFATLNGMPISVLRIDGDRQWHFRDHPNEPAEKGFVSQLLSRAHATISTISLKNRIALCAGYIGLNLPMAVEPPLPDVLQLVVVGNPEQRKDYLDQLRRQVSKRVPQKPDLPE